MAVTTIGMVPVASRAARPARRRRGEDEVDAEPDQLARQLRKPLGPALRRAELKDDGPALNVAELGQLATEGVEQPDGVRRAGHQDADARGPGHLLRGAETRPGPDTHGKEEFPPPHSVTSSARATARNLHSDMKPLDLRIAPRRGVVHLKHRRPRRRWRALRERHCCTEHKGEPEGTRVACAVPRS
jgi:hypothetical protein